MQNRLKIPKKNSLKETFSIALNDLVIQWIKGVTNVNIAYTLRYISTFLSFAV